MVVLGTSAIVVVCSLLVGNYGLVAGWRPAKGSNRSGDVHRPVASSVLQVAYGAARSERAAAESGRAEAAAASQVRQGRSDSTRSDRAQRAASGMAAGSGRSSSASGSATELALRTQRAQMLTQLSSQLSASRRTLLQTAFDKLGLLSWLGASSEDESAASVHDWHTKRKEVRVACDVNHLPTSDSTIVNMNVGRGLGSKEQQDAFDKEVLSQLDSSHIVREHLAACSKAVDGMIDGLSTQFTRSSEANKKYSGSFSEVLDTLDDFKKTATLVKAFEQDHLSASEFLVNKMDLMELDIAKLNVQPKLDAEAQAKMADYEVAKRWASTDPEDQAWREQEVARLADQVATAGGDVEARVSGLKAGFDRVTAENERLKESLAQLQTLIPPEELARRGGTDDRTSKPDSACSLLLSESDDLKGAAKTLSTLKTEAEGWKRFAPSEFLPKIDAELVKLRASKGPLYTEETTTMLNAKVEEAVEANTRMSALQTEFLRNLPAHSDRLHDQARMLASAFVTSLKEYKACCSRAVARSEDAQWESKAQAVNGHVDKLNEEMETLQNWNEGLGKLPGDSVAVVRGQITGLYSKLKAVLSAGYAFRSAALKEDLRQVDAYVEDLLRRLQAVEKKEADSSLVASGSDDADGSTVRKPSTVVVAEGNDVGDDSTVSKDTKVDTTERDTGGVSENVNMQELVALKGGGRKTNVST